MIGVRPKIADKAAQAPRIKRMPRSWRLANKPVRSITFEDGCGMGWTVRAVETIRQTPAPVKYVVVTGAPSWAEYWVSTLCALPSDREMVVVNRPGFSGSGPKDCVYDIRVQAAALAPLLKPAPGQKIVLIGHSYGAAIATLMASQNPQRTIGLVLLSGYFGELGPTARRLVKLGSKLMRVIPRDLRHAILEVTSQAPQLTHVCDALARLTIPVHLIHGDKDDYAPIEAAKKLIGGIKTRRPVRFEAVAGGDHFLHGGPPHLLPRMLEKCIPSRKGFTWPQIVLPGFESQPLVAPRA